MSASLVGSEMCIRDRPALERRENLDKAWLIARRALYQSAHAGAASIATVRAAPSSLRPLPLRPLPGSLL
eukprot:4675691-Alexandrium_andersonii.AAC.1